MGINNFDTAVIELVNDLQKEGQRLKNLREEQAAI